MAKDKITSEEEPMTTTTKDGLAGGRVPVTETVMDAQVSEGTALPVDQVAADAQVERDANEIQANAGADFHLPKDEVERGLEPLAADDNVPADEPIIEEAKAETTTYLLDMREIGENLKNLPELCRAAGFGFAENAMVHEVYITVPKGTKRPEWFAKYGSSVV